MVYPRMRVWGFGLLFLAWLGFLAFLAIRMHGRVVVARPQIERSNLVVIATLTEQDGRPAAVVNVQKALAADDPAWKQLAGQRLELNELAFFSAKQGWAGPGDYILPLTRVTENGKERTEVTLLPLTPGYFPVTSELTVEVGKKPELMAGRLAELTGTPASRIREMIGQPMVKLWNVPVRSDAELRAFVNQIHEAGGEVGMRVPAEARIYPATADVLEQVEDDIARK